MTKLRQLHDEFEECLELIFRGEAVEACLSRYPEHADELRGLLETATAAKRAVSVEPDARFRARARQELFAAMRERPAAAPVRSPGFRWSWQPAWAVATAAFVLMVMAASGTVLVSTSSMPDQPLYGVKVATERVRLAVTTSPDGKAGLHAALADRRVSEIVYLAEKGKAAQLADITGDLDLHLDRITALAGNEIVTAYGETMAPALMSGAEGGVEMAVPTEDALLPAAVPGPSLTASQTVPAAGAGAAPPATTEFVLDIPPDQNSGTDKMTGPSPAIAARGAAAGDSLPPEGSLRATVTFQAANNSARLRAALLKAPPEARPALLRAIMVSETGYEKVLQSLSE